MRTSGRLENSVRIAYSLHPEAIKTQGAQIFRYAGAGCQAPIPVSLEPENAQGTVSCKPAAARNTLVDQITAGLLLSRFIF
jgi:hypothetical protein